MKLTLRDLRLVMAALMVCLLAACNRDAACWAPTDGQQGAGGGPVVPVGQGGFGEEPGPDPQGADERWECAGSVIDCTNEADPNVQMCPNVTGWGPSEPDAVDDAIAQCEYALLLKHERSYLCEATILDCVLLHGSKFSCTGVPRCKRGTSCREDGEKWFNACPSNGVPVIEHSPERARQELLDDCQKDLAAGGDSGPWFCMPGSLKCELDE